MQWAELASAWPGLKDERELARETRLLAEGASRLAAQRVRGVRLGGSGAPVAAAQHDEYRCVVACFLLSARDTFDAIVRVLGARLLIQGEVLLRTLFEAVIELLHMSKDPIARAGQFVAFVGQEKDRFADGVKRIAGEAGIDVAGAEPDSAHGEREGASGRDLRPERRIQSSWHGMSFRKLLEQVCKVEPGWKGYYEILYVPASQLAHSSTTAVLQYRHLDPDAGQFDPRKGARRARMIVLLAGYSLLQATAVAEEACSLGLGESLCQLDRRFNEMALARKEGGGR